MRSFTRRIPVRLAVACGLALALGHADAARPREESRRRILDALDLRFPEIAFEQADLEDVLRFLSSEARVNILLDPSVSGPPAKKPTPGPPGGKTSLDTSFNTSRKTETANSGITLHLKNVPLKVVLKYALRFKNLRYIVEDYAIVVVPIGGAPPEGLQTEVFRLKTPSGGAPQLKPRRSGRRF